MHETTRGGARRRPTKVKPPCKKPQSKNRLVHGCICCEAQDTLDLGLCWFPHLPIITCWSGEARAPGIERGRAGLKSFCSVQDVSVLCQDCASVVDVLHSFFTFSSLTLEAFLCLRMGCSMVQQSVLLALLLSFSGLDFGQACSMVVYENPANCEDKSLNWPLHQAAIWKTPKGNPYFGWSRNGRYSALKFVHAYRSVYPRRFALESKQLWPIYLRLFAIHICPILNQKTLWHLRKRNLAWFPCRSTSLVDYSCDNSCRCTLL